MRGRFTPVTFSDARMDKKVKTLKKREKELGFEYNLDKRFIYPERDLKRVIRNLKRDNLNDKFYYDVIEESLKKKSSLPVIPQSNIKVANNQPKIETPPLPKQPEPVAAATALPKIDPVTQLTSTETALLSPDEQAIRLKQRGIA